MPLPSPNPKEKKKEFIGRCMKCSDMKKEFPERDQRLSVCLSRWAQAKKSEKMAKVMSVMKDQFYSLVKKEVVKSYRREFDEITSGDDYSIHKVAKDGRPILEQVYSACRKSKKTREEAIEIAWKSVAHFRDENSAMYHLSQIQKTLVSIVELKSQLRQKEAASA